MRLTAYKTGLFAILLIIKAASVIGQDGTNGDPSKILLSDTSWKTLFNGKNLEGWEVKCDAKDKEKVFWTVDNGTILCNSLNSADHNYVWLQSLKEFSDFELQLKFQVSRSQTGNSGVQFRSRYDDKAVVEEGITGWIDGPQADIEPNDPWRIGLIYDETREAKRWINPSLPNWEISREEYAPEKVFFRFDDEDSGWNEMTIICREMHVLITVNDVLVSDYDGTGVLDDEAHKKHNVGERGHIAFQLHKYSQNFIRFKDIEIREIE